MVMYWKLLARLTVAFLFPMAGCASGSRPDTLPTQANASSGITGTTRFEVVSGVRGGETTSRPASIEFAIAPVDGITPAYARALFVKSGAQGAFRVNLSPYWIGASEKALDSKRYSPGEAVFSEMVVGVPAETFVTVALAQTGYAP